MEESEVPAGRLPKKSVLEAALFLANRPLRLEELAPYCEGNADVAEGLLAELSEDYDKQGSALHVTKLEDPARLGGPEYRLELRDEYVPVVAGLSQNVELSKKALRILALVAKKKKLLQSELKYFFRGDVYEYVDELEKKGYLKAVKHKTTKELKPTPLFYEHFKSFE